MNRNWMMATLASMCVAAASLPGGNQESRAIFERRIAPILKSPNPSTCSECHLSGVDLKDYIRATESETYAALRDGGMIDRQNPSESHILKLIQMSRPQTSLVTKTARNMEYEAFREWIVAAAKNPEFTSLPKSTKPAGSSVPVEVVRHTRIDNVLASFERNIWSQQGRCMGCHTPGTPENAEHVKKYGERVKWFVPDSAEATMQRLIKQNLINVEKPEDSLLLLKPLNKVPHGGGVKFLYGDAGYKQFRTWIEDYAASVKGSYRTKSDLPKPSSETLVYTNCILNVTDTPEAWGDKLLAVDIYPWDSAKGAWSVKPIASGDRGVWAKGRSTNILVFLTVSPNTESERESRRNPRMPAGKYLLKYYCDTGGKLNSDFRKPTDSQEFYQGSQEITSEWRTGWGNPTKVKVDIRN